MNISYEAAILIIFVLTVVIPTGIQMIRMGTFSSLKKPWERTPFEININKLNEIAKKLRSRKDPKLNSSISSLKTWYETFYDILDPKTKNNTNVSETIDNIVKNCIKQFEHSDDLWKMAKAHKNKTARNKSLRTRAQILSELYKTIDHVVELVSKYQKEKLEKYIESQTNLSVLRDDLSRSLDIALKVEERVDQVENDIFGNYEKNI